MEWDPSRGAGAAGSRSRSWLLVDISIVVEVVVESLIYQIHLKVSYNGQMLTEAPTKPSRFRSAIWNHKILLFIAVWVIVLMLTSTVYTIVNAPRSFLGFAYVGLSDTGDNINSPHTVEYFFSTTETLDQIIAESRAKGFAYDGKRIPYGNGDYTALTYYLSYKGRDESLDYIDSNDMRLFAKAYHLRNPTGTAIVGMYGKDLYSALSGR
jgi:hypothetical protein